VETPDRRICQFRAGAALQLSAELAVLARSAAQQQPVSSIELPAVSTADIRAMVRSYQLVPVRWLPGVDGVEALAGMSGSM
jgi:hypothetical protein